MSRKQPTQQPVPKTKQAPSELIDHVVLGGFLCLLSLRVTITEAPVAPQSAMNLTLSDPLYSVLVSCALLALATFWWLRCLLPRGPKAYRTGLEIGLGILLLGAILAACFASNKRLALNAILVFFAPACAGLTLIQLIDRPARLRLVLVFLVGLGLIAAVQAFGQIQENRTMIEQHEADPNQMFEPLGIDPNTLESFLFEHRLYSRGIRSYFTTRNSAGCFALIALFAALALRGFRPPPRPETTKLGPATITHAIVLATLFVGFILSRSKAGIIGLTAGIICWAIGRRYGPWLVRHKGHICVALIVLAIAGGFMLGLYGHHHGRLPGGHSMLVRWQYWQAAGRMIADHPWLGIGPGNFATWYQHYKVPEALEAVADPHNVLISLGAQYGPLGLLGLLLLILGPLFLKRESPPPHPPMPTPSDVTPTAHFLVAGIALVLALLILRTAFVPFPHVPSALVLVYLIVMQLLLPLLIGLGSILWMLQPKVTGRRSPTSGIPPLLAGCGIIAVLVANLSDFAIFEPANLMGVWFLVACSLAALRLSSPTSEQTRPRLYPLLVAGLLCSFCGLSYALTARPVARSTDSLALANKALEQGLYDQAQYHLGQATDADPRSPLAPYTAGRVYLSHYQQTSPPNRDLLEYARAALETAIARNPADYRAYEKLGEVYALAENWNKAYEAYGQAGERYPGIARLQVALGRCAEKRNDPFQAADHYQEAKSIEDRFRAAFKQQYPEYPGVVSRLGEAEYRFLEERLAILGALRQ